MCNLYTERLSTAEVMAHFGVENPVASNAGEEVYPGAPGLVVRKHVGARVMQFMTWGFPLRLRGMSPTAKPKPVNNVADLTKPMWKGARRSTPVALPDPADGVRRGGGAKGRQDAHLVSIRDRPLFACVGLWRVSDEWGPVYAGVMTDCNEAIRPVHDRMPVLLHADEHDAWLDGTFDDALAFQERCFPRRPDHDEPHRRAVGQTKARQCNGRYGFMTFGHQAALGSTRRRGRTARGRFAAP